MAAVDTDMIFAARRFVDPNMVRTTNPYWFADTLAAVNGHDGEQRRKHDSSSSLS